MCMYRDNIQYEVDLPDERLQSTGERSKGNSCVVVHPHLNHESLVSTPRAVWDTPYDISLDGFLHLTSRLLSATVYSRTYRIIYWSWGFFFYLPRNEFFPEGFVQYIVFSFMRLRTKWHNCEYTVINYLWYDILISNNLV